MNMQEGQENRKNTRNEMPTDFPAGETVPRRTRPTSAGDNRENMET
jgi:hypothetical protein